MIMANREVSRIGLTATCDSWTVGKMTFHIQSVELDEKMATSVRIVI
jgi:hypothetical protein